MIWECLDTVADQTICFDFYNNTKVEIHSCLGGGLPTYQAASNMQHDAKQLPVRSDSWRQ